MLSIPPTEEEPVARYVDAIDLPMTPEEVFDFLADFSRTPEWDPGVVEAERLSGGPIGLGSRFRVVVSFLGRQLPLEYEITAFERPQRLVLRGGDDSLTSLDEITFVSRPGGTRVTYEAQVRLTGVARFADPLLQLLFQRVGDLAVRGLREWASGRPSRDETAEPLRRTPESHSPGAF